MTGKILIFGATGAVGSSLAKLLNENSIATHLIGKNEEETKIYIQDLVKADMEEAGSEDVFRKVKKDFETKSISIEDLEIKKQMEKALSRAKEDFK